MNLSLINNGCVKEEGIANSVFGKLSESRIEYVYNIEIRSDMNGIWYNR